MRLAVISPSQFSLFCVLRIRDPHLCRCQTVTVQRCTVAEGLFSGYQPQPKLRCCF